MGWGAGADLHYLERSSNVDIRAVLDMHASVSSRTGCAKA